MNLSKIFVSGAAGYIGSNLVDQLLEFGHEVVGWDNFSTGFNEFLELSKKSPKFTLIEGDNLKLDELKKAMKGCDFVFHLAANADVRDGLNHPNRDLEQNTIATFNILEAMRANSINQLAFSSTGSIYGESKNIPTPENDNFPIQTSLYGASKLACEGMIQAYCEGYNLKSYIFRFVSILGPRYTHGHVFDFVKQLKENPNKLKVLGNGTQRKSYLFVHDCIDAMLHVISKEEVNQAPYKVAIYNLGTNEYCKVTNSIDWICEMLNVSPTLEFTGGDRGWIGDNPFIFLDTKKIISTGWAPKRSIKEGVQETVKWLVKNPWVFERR